jgi:hypothetical protein
VARIRVGLEADEVGAEHALEDLLTLWQAAEDLGRREGRVDEEGNVGLGDELADHLRSEQEVVCDEARLVSQESIGAATRCSKTHSRG